MTVGKRQLRGRVGTNLFDGVDEVVDGEAAAHGLLLHAGGVFGHLDEAAALGLRRVRFRRIKRSAGVSLTARLRGTPGQDVAIVTVLRGAPGPLGEDSRVEGLDAGQLKLLWS
jgi:hypothetical protein